MLFSSSLIPVTTTVCSVLWHTKIPGVHQEMADLHKDDVFEDEDYSDYFTDDESEEEEDDGGLDMRISWKDFCRFNAGVPMGTIQEPRPLVSCQGIRLCDEISHWAFASALFETSTTRSLWIQRIDRREFPENSWTVGLHVCSLYQQSPESRVINQGADYALYGLKVL